MFRLLFCIFRLIGSPESISEIGHSLDTTGSHYIFICLIFYFRFFLFYIPLWSLRRVVHYCSSRLKNSHCYFRSSFNLRYQFHDFQFDVYTWFLDYTYYYFRFYSCFISRKDYLFSPILINNHLKRMFLFISF